MNIKFINAAIPYEKRIKHKDILIENGIIVKIGEIKKSSDVCIDIGGNYLIPGFIDCHTHGFRGISSESCNEKLEELAIEYAKRGTTGFYATIGPRMLSEYISLVNKYKRVFNREYKGARFLGLHIEGPYLNPEKAGAINSSRLYEVNIKELETFLKYSSDTVRIMTIAPEVNNGIEAVKLLIKYGIIPSIGHTNATFKEAMIAINKGITHSTHTFNGMRSFNHREVGVLGAILLDERVYCELIADGVHVSKEAVKLLLKVKGKDKVIAVSDGGISCGKQYEDGHVFEDGSFVINGAVYSSNGRTLCGSTKDLYDHFKMFVQEYKYTLYEAVRLTSTNCAEHMNIKAGKIEIGYEANFNIMDKELNLIETYVLGERVK